LTWVFGYVLALGEGHLFIGGTGFDYTALRYEDVLFRWMFAVITCSIVGGALEGRIRDSAYIVFAFVCSLLIHSVPAHWVWTDIGWLHNIGAIDLAGAASVHVVAGMATLVGSLLLGPRSGRWQGHYKQLVAVPGSRMPSYGAGTLIVWFGWFGLVTAASRFVSGLASAQVGANAAVNVALGGAAGGVVAALLTRAFVKARDWDLGAACNGVMAGLVSVSAGGHVIPPWAAIVSGVVGSLIYFGSARLVSYLQIDDATEAISVHLSAGLWGLATVGFFADPDMMVRATVPEGQSPDGVLSGFVLGGSGVLLGVQVLQFLCAACWSAVLSALTFLFLSLIGRLRLKDDDAQVTKFVVRSASEQSGAGVAAANAAAAIKAADDDDDPSYSYDYEYVEVNAEGEEKVLRVRSTSEPSKSAANGTNQKKDVKNKKDNEDEASYEYSYVYEYQDENGNVIESKSRNKEEDEEGQEEDDEEEEERGGSVMRRRRRRRRKRMMMMMMMIEEEEEE
jgi:ammonia channel protein AmtB